MLLLTIFRKEDIVQRCSLAICTRKREFPYSIQWNRECINFSQLRCDIIENYVKGRSLICYNARTSFKFECSTAMRIE